MRRALLVLALAASPAAAQQAVQGQAPAFQLEHFEPQADPERSILNVAGADVRGHLAASTGVLCHHADQPLVADPTAGTAEAVVASQTRCEILGSLGLFGVAQLDVALPVVLAQQAANDDALAVGALDRPTAGDLRVTPKVQLFQRVAGLAMALQAPLYLPTGDGGTFNSGGGLRLETRVIADWRAGPWHVAAHAGYQLQNVLRLHNVTLDDAFRWAVGVRAPTGLRDLRAFSTLFGQISTGVGRDPGRPGVTLEDGRDDPAEWLAGLEYRLPGGLLARAGGGRGVSVGLGAPDWRVLAGVDWLGPARAFAAEAWGDRRDALTRLRLTLFAPSLAQAAAVADRRRAAPGPDAVVSVDTATVGRPADVTLGLELGQAARPGRPDALLVAPSLALAVTDDVELAADAPAAVGRGASGLGDVGVRLKALAVDAADHAFGAGLVIPVVLPTATRADLTTGRARIGTLGLGAVHLGGLDLTTTLGVHLEDDLGASSPWAPVVEYGFGQRWHLGSTWQLGTELFGEHPLDDLLRPDVLGTAGTIGRELSGITWDLGVRASQYGDALTQVDVLLRGMWHPEAPRPLPPVVVAPPPAPSVPPGPIDTDGDGLVDADDRCPADPEDVDDFQDHDGCPDLDNDGDGVADAQDWCPNESGIRQWEGCNGVTVAVPFPFASARPEPEAAPLLAEMAAILREHATVRGVLIEGHTDDRGTEAFNLRLSLERALAIREALVAAGIPAGRIEVMGHGETSPVVAVDGLAGDALAGARAQNRRVRFVLLRRSGGEAVSRAAAVLR
ncbi:MAG: OmpA family protein [bacterium]